ncbi:Reducing polyketide synthase dep5 [Diatrype stigma]|uniref:Reducing polyketide synthase dep5 n=1 Tax=Diatrype stigma TaxID=117547 RepID=A0AAN9VBX7_9PEZI
MALLSRLLMVDLDEFTEEGRSVASYGIDSMIGAEFRNWIFRELALDIAFQQLLGPNLTIGKLSEMVCA